MMVVVGNIYIKRHTRDYNSVKDASRGQELLGTLVWFDGHQNKEKIRKRDKSNGLVCWLGRKIGEGNKN